MTSNLPKRGISAETTTWGQVSLPAKAERVFGKPGKGDHTAMYLDRDGKVQSFHYRLPEPKKKAPVDQTTEEGVTESVRSRPDVSRRGFEMIGDLRTDALHEALSRAPIGDDTLMALLVLALAGRNISIQSGAASDVYGFARMDRHAIGLVDGTGQLAFDRDALRSAARSALVDALSARENRTDSGIVARIAGASIGADGFLSNMATDEFLSCLSRTALERSCTATPVLPRSKVKDTRAALVEHFKEQRYVHPAALFAPDEAKLAAWRKADPSAGADQPQDEPEHAEEDTDVVEPSDDAYRVAAE